MCETVQSCSSEAIAADQVGPASQTAGFNRPKGAFPEMEWVARHIRVGGHWSGTDRAAGRWASLLRLHRPERRKPGLDASVSPYRVDGDDLLSVEFVPAKSVNQAMDGVCGRLSAVGDLRFSTEPCGPVTVMLLNDEVGERSHCQQR